MTYAADLVVWRHGRTAWNDAGRFQGHLDPPLDAVGLSQVALAAPAVLALRPSLVLSSDLVRARATAESLGLPVTYDARLREIDVGEWGGLTHPEIAERFPDTYAAWQRGEDVRREGGETLADVSARVVAAVADPLSSEHEGPVVVVTHGGAARALVLALLGLPPNAPFASLGNARWASLQRRSSGWRLTAYNVGREAEATEPRNDDATAEPVL